MPTNLFAMTELLSGLLQQINDFLWTYIMIAMLIGTAIWFSFKTKFVQFTEIREMVSLLAHSSSKSKKSHHISSFQAFCISLASRVGTGNLAGVGTAIFVGGPGAVFWMWVIALLGAVSAFIESTLAQIFKERNEDVYIGGPAYYIQKGLGKRWMAILFAVCITITFGLIFSSVQSNTIAHSLNESMGVSYIVTGIVLAILSLGIIIGGVHRIAFVSSIIVPVMAIVYIVLAVVVILFNADRILGVLDLIIGNAFGWHQAVGGGVGAALMQGIRRGLFSNEAGIGSAPNAAATASVSHPVQQGLIQALGVFTDTIIICSCTAFIILFAEPQAVEGLDGIRLTQAALINEIGPFGGVFITIAIFFFAFTSIIGNYYYGESNILFFTKNRAVLLGYRVSVGLMILIGALLSLDVVWTLADISMAIMGLVNLVAILLLGKYAIIALKDYRSQKKSGVKNPTFKSSTIPEIEDKIECWK